MEAIEGLCEAALLGAALFGVSAAVTLVQCGNKRGAKNRGESLSKKTKRTSKAAKKSAESVKRSARTAKERTKESARSLKKPAGNAPPSVKSKRSKSASEKAAASARPAPLQQKSQGPEWVQAARPTDAPSVRTAAPMVVGSQRGLQEEVTKSQKTEGFSARQELPPGADLHMQPQQLRFAQQGGILNVVLHNPSGQRQAVKVKCSDNKLYRVNPVYAFVEPNSTLQVNVSRQNGAPKADKLVFVTAEAPADEVQPQAFFKNRKANNNQHVSILPLLA